MIALGIVLLVLVLIAILRLGVHGEYSEDGLLVQLRVGPLRLTVYPAKEKPKKKKHKKVKNENKTEAKAKDKKNKKGGSAETIKKLLPELFKALGKLKRRLCINRLKIYYMSASEDPAKAAIAFGCASAGAGVVAAIFENNFRIRKRDIRTSVSFEEKEPKVYIDFIMSMAVWEILYVAVPLAVRSIKMLMQQEKTKSESRKEE